MFQIKLYNMISFRSKEMEIFVIPSVSIEYFAEYTGIRIAWLFFMILFAVVNKNGENGTEDD